MSGIITFLASLAFSELIVVFSLLFVGYMIYHKTNSEELYTKINEIKDRHRAELWNFTFDNLAVIEAQAMNVAEEIINKAPDIDCSSRCGLDYKSTQLNMFALVLERTLYTDIFEKVKTTIKVNGFSDMSEAELTIYIENKSEAFLRHSRKKINSRIWFFPLLKGSDNLRFTSEDSLKFTSKLIHKAIDIKKDETKEIKELKQKYSLWHKINVVGKVIRKFSK